MNTKYKLMLKRMKEKDKSNIKSKKEWFAYILKCKDGKYYTGITNNIERRVKMHNEGKASRFTRSRRPVKLLYKEGSFTRSQAMMRECEIKSLTKNKKEELIFNT